MTFSSVIRRRGDEDLKKTDGNFWEEKKFGFWE
jgi:hypothetical protein